MTTDADQEDIAGDNESLGHNEPMVYEVEEDGTDGEPVVWTIYRISSLGRCGLELIASKTGWPAADPPKFLQAAYDRGHQNERNILNMYMKQYGVALTDFQARVEYVIAPGVKIVGHIDALELGSGRIVDAKFYASDHVDKIARDPEKYMPEMYLWQGAGYGASLGNRGVDFVFGRRNLTTNELDGIEVVSYEWEELKPYLGKVRLKVMQCERIAREDLEWPLCEDAKRFPCPFHELRLGKGGKIEAKKNSKSASEVKTFESSDTAGLAKTLWEEREAQSQAEANAKAGKDELNKRLMYLMEQHAGEAVKTETWDIEGVKVMRMVKENPVYDWVAIRKDIPNFDEKYKKPGTKIVYLQRGKGDV